MKPILLGLILSLGICILINDGQLYAQKIKFPNLMPFRNQPKVEPIPLTDTKPAPFIPIPRINLFPSAPPEGTLLERIQDNSQHFFQQTGATMSNWADQTNYSIRRSSEQTWNFLSHSLPQADWWNPQPKPEPMIQPPSRNAYDLKHEPKIRF